MKTGLAPSREIAPAVGEGERHRDHPHHAFTPKAINASNKASLPDATHGMRAADIRGHGFFQCHHTGPEDKALLITGSLRSRPGFHCAGIGTGPSNQAAECSSSPRSHSRQSVEDCNFIISPTGRLLCGRYVYSD